VGVARVVIQTRQHLAALVPVGPGLVLNLLRWGTDIRPWADLPLPSEDVKKAGLSERELTMARQLVDDMSGDWDPDEFKDEFKDEILRLVDRKVKAGQTETVTQPEPEEDASGEGRGAKIIDLTELLQRSLRKGGGKSKPAASRDDSDEDEEAPAPKAAAKKRKPAAKAPARAAARKAPARARRAA
jgi:DNA end-binding protein Ku